MLIEVPKGMTKLQIRFETPALFSTHSMVMGSVAEEELVEKAVISAGPIALKWRPGRTFPMTFNSRGRATNTKVARPRRTARVNSPRERRDSNPASAKTLLTRKKTPK